MRQEVTLEKIFLEKIILALVLAILMSGTTQADVYYEDVTFDFDSLSNNLDGGAAAIQDYMNGILSDYDATVIVTGGGGGPIVTTATNPLGPDVWIMDDGGPSRDDWLSFEFSRDITSVSFDWATLTNPFVAVADGEVYFDSGKTNSNIATGTVTYSDFTVPVYTLVFHNSKSGWVGIDNLKVTIDPPQPLMSVVPVPAAVLLGMFGLGTAGIKLRKSP
jgi:hypothetical protein